MPSVTANPTTLVSDATTGDQPWINPENAAAQDDTAAQSAVTGDAIGGETTQYLKCTGFDFSAIPSGATIDGIVVEVEVYENTQGATWHRCLLVKAGAIQSYDLSPETAVNYEDDDTYDTIGGSSELWDDTWSRSDIVNSGFGCAIAFDWQAGSPFSGNDVFVDHVQMTVYYTASAAPEINITGNGQNIADGDSSPSESDHTDFGTATENSGTVERTFTIQNTGDGELTLDGTPKVALSGTDADQFSVTSQPSSPVAAAGSTTFTIEYAPDETGTHNATVSIDNDDGDEDPYTFDITGEGTEAASGGSTGSLILHQITYLRRAADDGWLD